MEWCKRLDTVVNLQDYIDLTQALDDEGTLKIPLNMKSIGSVVKCLSLEIEHFNKCDGNGAAFKIFSGLLSSPASEAWRFLSTEVVGVIQYWLEAVRKHLISHHIHWWSFLRHLLRFIKEARKKHSLISNVLVKETAETILDLATSRKMDIAQRYETLCVFNLVCCETNRQVRLAWKNKLEPYFVRLATIIATTGHLPSQLAATETLQRWLIHRENKHVRSEAAKKWLHSHLYERATIDMFLNRDWMHFTLDARDFLNSHNDAKGKVTSVVCRKLHVGASVFITGDEKLPYWLDINSGDNSVTVMLDSHRLKMLAQSDDSYEHLTIGRTQVSLVRLYRDSNEVNIKVITVDTPVFIPSGIKACNQQACEVKITISSRSNIARVDAALRTVFDNKYQTTLGVEEEIVLSPPRPGEDGCVQNSTAATKRFSHLVKGKGRKSHPGGAVWLRRIDAVRSPSTTSTSSLLQLRERLANLPYWEYTKEPERVCAEPELSRVRELINESELHSYDSCSTLKLSRFRAEQKFTRTKSQSDSEYIKKNYSKNDERSANTLKECQSDNDFVNETIEQATESSVIGLVISSADDSIINATVEPKPICKDNIFQLLLQEALQSNNEKGRMIDSGINTEEENKTQEHESETIEDTQYTGGKNTKTPVRLNQEDKKTPKKFTIVSKSTSDESNTEAIIETPVNYVSFRRRNQLKKSIRRQVTEKIDENKTFDEHVIEDFFSQHIAENQKGDIIISPNLAKKINETSSEDSDDSFTNKVTILNVQTETTDMDVLACLNYIVDKVCNDIEKERVESDLRKDKENKDSVGKKLSKQTMKYRNKKQKVKGKLKLEPVKMSTIIESDVNKTSSSDTKISGNNEKIGRKRKLYSPKDEKRELDKIANEVVNTSDSDAIEVNTKALKSDEIDSDNIVLAEIRKDKSAKIEQHMATTPKSVKHNSIASSYKDIQQERQQHKRIRVRRSRGKNVKLTPSPKTKNIDDAFERLKENIESNDVIIADKKTSKDIAIYNFTSDSEDEDFKQKKVEIQKRISSTTIESNTSALSTRRRRRKVSHTEGSKESCKEANAIPNTRKKLTRHKTPKSKAMESIIDAEGNDLIDEKLREATTEPLNTSLSADIEKEIVKELEPIIRAPELEMIVDENANLETKYTKENDIVITEKVVKENAKRESKTNTKERIRKEKKIKDNKSNKLGMESISQSPELKVIVGENVNLGTEYTKENDVVITEKVVRENATRENKTNTKESIKKKKKIKENKSNKLGMEPIIQAPELEVIVGENANFDTEHTKENNKVINEEGAKKNVKTEKMINTKVSKSKCKTYKGIKTDILDMEKDNTKDDKTLSPLPGLIIETEKLRPDSKVSLFSTKFIKKLEKICKDGSEAYSDTINTENMFSDSERQNCSPQTNITEELGINRQESTTLKRSAAGGKNFDAVEETVSPDNSSKISKDNSATIKRNRLRLRRRMANDFSEKNESPIYKQQITQHKKAEEQSRKNIINEPKRSKKTIKSSVQETNLDEIICIKSEIITSSKSLPKSRSQSREIEVVDLTLYNSNIDELKSEKSIATEGITGHGDMDEMPPSPKSLGEQLSPRGVQFEEHREYYIQLYKEINRSKDSADEMKLPNDKSDTPAKTIVQDKTSELSSESIGKIKHALFGEKDYKIANMLPSRHDPESGRSSRSSIESNKKSIESFKSRTTKANQSAKNRKSQISPINFEDFDMRNPCISKSQAETLNSQTSESLETIKENSKNKALAPERLLRSTQVTSSVSKEGQEESTPKSAVKRKSPIPENIPVKRRRLDNQIREDALGTSMSSKVDDWLRKTSSMRSRVDDVFQPLYDAFQSQNEKLDTTLDEIDHNTAKEWVGLLVNAQQKLEEMEEQTRNEYQVAIDNNAQYFARQLEQCERYVASQVKDLDQSARQRHYEYQSWLKERAREVLRRDCAQKRAMRDLLREDMQAALKHVLERRDINE